MAINYPASPVGGTTSLPQYLQQKQSQQQPAGQNPANLLGSNGVQVAGQTAAPAPAKKEPSPVQQQFGAGAPAGAAPKPAVAPPPQPVGPVSGTGNPTIPAAPPVAPPPAAVPASGPPLQENAPGAAGFNFGDYLTHQLTGGANRYSSPLIQQLQDSMNHQLDTQQRREEDRLTADAAARGVYHGSPLTNSFGDLAERMTQARTDANSSLLARIADAGAQDQQNNVGNMFQFGNGQLSAQQLQAYILQMMAQTGGAGGPTIPGSIDAYGNLPAPQAPDYSGIYQMLGGLYGPKPAAPAGAAK